VTREEDDKAHQQRSLRWTWDERKNSVRLWGHLRADQGATVVQALERCAHGIGRNPSGTWDPLPQRAADALVELCGQALAADSDADRATVVIHADVSALVAIEGSALSEEGFALSSEALRRSCCDCRLQIVAHDRDGDAKCSAPEIRCAPRASLAPRSQGAEERCIPGRYVSDEQHRERGCRGARMPPGLRGGAPRDRAGVSLGEPVAGAPAAGPGPGLRLPRLQSQALSALTPCLALDQGRAHRSRQPLPSVWLSPLPRSRRGLGDEDRQGRAPGVLPPNGLVFEPAPEPLCDDIFSRFLWDMASEVADSS